MHTDVGDGAARHDNFLTHFKSSWNAHSLNGCIDTKTTCHFHDCFSRFAVTIVDGRGCAKAFGDFKAVVLQRSCYLEDTMSKVGVHLPRSCGVRIGQRVARNGLASEVHGKEMIQAREVLDLEVASVRCHATPKGGQWQMRHDLRKHEFALMHTSLLRMTTKNLYSAARCSNRDQNKTSISVNESLTYNSLS